MGHQTNRIAVQKIEMTMKFNCVNLHLLNGAMECGMTYNELFESAHHKAIPQQRNNAIEHVTNADTFRANVRNLCGQFICSQTLFLNVKLCHQDCIGHQQSNFIGLHEKKWKIVLAKSNDLMLSHESKHLNKIKYYQQ